MQAVMHHQIESLVSLWHWINLIALSWRLCSFAAFSPKRDEVQRNAQVVWKAMQVLQNNFIVEREFVIIVDHIFCFVVFLLFVSARSSLLLTLALFCWYRNDRQRLTDTRTMWKICDSNDLFFVCEFLFSLFWDRRVYSSLRCRGWTQSNFNLCV